MSGYFRETVDRMKGYTPGEQPKGKKLLKLNTNENPFPPSPKVVEAIKTIDFESLKRYPTPFADPVKEAAEKIYGFPKEQIIVGNGSDDILTILFRCFADQGDKVGWFSPSYSLYGALANIQGTVQVNVPLNEDFSLPDNAVEMAKGCKLFFVVRPNAPTGNAFEKSKLRDFIEKFEGVVCIDEAYADFCKDNCLDFVNKYPNVVVSRSLSKSYSLAGMRCGLAFGSAELISGMHKVKDSYNVNAVTQVAAAAALLDTEAFKSNTAAIKATRENSCKVLKQHGFEVCPSETNFVFCKPPIQAKQLVDDVRHDGYLIRYFNVPGLDQYVRISIGSDAEMDGFFSAVKTSLAKNGKAVVNGN